MQYRDSSAFSFFLRVEPLLLFLVFYLPGYLAQSSPVSGKIFNSIAFNLTYLVAVLPRVALLLYLMILRSHASDSDASDGAILEGYGVVPFRARDLGWILLAIAAIEMVVIPLSVVGSAVGGGFGAHESKLIGSAVHWRLTRPGILPLVFITTITIGYSEELYFRSYLLTTLSRTGVGAVAAVTVSTILFALGHVYEGLPGLLGTAAIGVMLSLLFLWKRNIHIIAIAHGLYNFITLLATLSLTGAGK